MQEHTALLQNLEGFLFSLLFTQKPSANTPALAFQTHGVRPLCCSSFPPPAPHTAAAAAARLDAESLSFLLEIDISWSLISGGERWVGVFLHTEQHKELESS